MSCHGALQVGLVFCKNCDHLSQGLIFLVHWNKLIMNDEFENIVFMCARKQLITNDELANIVFVRARKQCLFHLNGIMASSNSEI
jgi:hypothetical protein